jgi:hypothetical protein
MKFQPSGLFHHTSVRHRLDAAGNIVFLPQFDNQRVSAKVKTGDWPAILYLDSLIVGSLAN